MFVSFGVEGENFAIFFLILLKICYTFVLLLILTNVYGISGLLDSIFLDN